MTMKLSFKILLLSFTLIGFSSTALPHCDGVDGPVVQAAIKSLDTKDINYVLIWVKKQHEQEIKDAFAKALVVRELGPEAKDVADHHFMETVVRIHREGEGEPFTGIKAAGRDLGPVIPTADKSLVTGSLKELKDILSTKLFNELDRKFQTLQERKTFDVSDTEAGREYVEAYVQYLHFADNLYKAADFVPHNENNSGQLEEEHHH